MSRIDQLKLFLADTPEDAFLQHALALEYIKLGQDAVARPLFEAILQRDPAYLGSYYHLGKLLERIGDQETAAGVYQSGMKVAKVQNDRHAYAELQAALEEMVD